MTRNLSRICLFFIIFGVCYSEPLDFKINVATDTTVSVALTKVLQDAYNKFRAFLIEMNKGLLMMGSKRVMSFRTLALECFSLIKSKSISTLDELQNTIQALNIIFPRCLSTGICAVGELLTLNETILCVKLLQTLEKLDLAFQISINYSAIILQETVSPEKRTK